MMTKRQTLLYTLLGVLIVFAYLGFAGFIADVRTGIKVVAQTQPRIGPWVGLRVPIFDNLKRGQSQPY